MTNIPKHPPQWVLDHIGRNWIVVTEEGQVWSRTRKSYVGYMNPKGYIQITITGYSNLKRSHVVWYAYYCCWPKLEIDHWDTNRSNDRIENLRELIHQENTCNGYGKENIMDWRPKET